MLVLDNDENKKYESEDEEIERLKEEKRKKKEEKKKQKELKKQAKAEAKKEKAKSEEKTETKKEEEAVEDSIEFKKEEDDNSIEFKKEEVTEEPVVEEKKTEEKIKVKEEKKKDEKKKEEPEEVEEKVVKKEKVKKEKVKGHKFRNFMLFLIFLLIAGAMGLGLVYLMSPYKLELNGEKDLIVSYGSTYEEQGATLKRFIFVSHKDIEVDGEVKTNKIGTYTITYKAESLSVARVVHVVDNEPPKIEFLDEDKPLVLNVNGEKKIYKDVHAYDLYDGEIDDIYYEEEIDMSKIGEYEITYSACDSSNNCATKVKKVEVKDVESPKITLNKGDLTLILGQDSYEEYGATASDNYDKNLGEIKIESNVDAKKIGEYEVKYSICDSSENCSTVVRKVSVKKEELINGRFKAHPEIDGTLESVLTLNSDTKTASITLNYCEGITSDTGTYSVNGNVITLELDYPWDDVNTFKFTIIDKNTLRFDTDIKACDPRKSEKFTRI